MSSRTFSDWVKIGLMGPIGKRLLRIRAGYSLARRILGSASGFDMESVKLMARFAIDESEKAYTGRQMAAWTTAFFPTELVYSAGFTAFSPEVASAIAAGLGAAPGFLLKADEEWYGSDLCSFHRAAAGGFLDGFLPRPKVFLASHHLCDGGPFLFRNIASLSKTPVVTVDVPPTATPEDEDAVAYVASQLKEALEVLEEIARKHVLPDDLRKAIRLSNECRAYMVQANEMRRRRPSPMSGLAGFSFIYMTFCGLGSKGAVDVYRALAQDLESRVAVPGGEQYRLLWLHLRPFFPNSLMLHLEKELGAIVAFEEMNEVYWDPLDEQRPLESLAAKMLSHFGYGSVERRIEAIMKMVSRYHIDGVINFANWGCRQSTGSAYMVKEALGAEGIPCLILDGDCVDGSNFSEGRALTRVEGLVEML
jgi:benzoyl-CoA reductase/2-hydroxyglutaryl-CoA dehydratase subunit BcrC/BadD/HgdB